MQGSTRSGGGGSRRGGRNSQVQQPQPIQRPIVQNSFLDYFSTNPTQMDGEVDIDAALHDDQMLNGFGEHGIPVYNHFLVSLRNLLSYQR